ncbi:T-complex protein 11 [Blomia tropicalis]|nr:T-complex protein 11 [Blomia tropicalis]
MSNSNENDNNSSGSSKESTGIFFMETKNENSENEIELNSKREKNTNIHSNNEEQDGFNENDDQNGDNKRQRPTNSNTNNVPVLGISPPNFVSFEEIMKTANDMGRMALVNEIVLNKDFKLEKKDDENALEKAVRINMQKAFWDILSEQLNESPPNYRQAISLLCEIKETLLMFLMPQHTQLKNEINEILDIDLITQQADNGIFEFQRFAQYVLSVCSRLCCPARDEMIRKLTQTVELIPLLKGIFELLETMRIDFANFYIQHFRPHIQLASVEYEREKFKKLLQASQKYNIDVLEFTSIWLKRNYQTLDLSQETELKIIFNKILISSYIDLLRCVSSSFNCYKIEENLTDNENNKKEPIEDDYPESLLLIRAKIDAIREKVFKVTLISSIFVVTFAAIGEPLQSIQEFRLELKKQLNIIISSAVEKPLHLLYSKQCELKSIMDNAALQVNKSIEDALKKYHVGPNGEPKPFDGKKLESLKFQINELALPTNRIRSVMERRILEFIERAISSSTAVPIQVPSGLSNFSTELAQMAGEFTRLVAYNRAVYSPYYTKIIAEVASPTHYISPNDLKEMEKALYN